MFGTNSASGFQFRLYSNNKWGATNENGFFRNPIYYVSPGFALFRDPSPSISKRYSTTIWVSLDFCNNQCINELVKTITG